MKMNTLSLFLIISSFFINSSLFAAKQVPQKPIMNSITENLHGPTIHTSSDGTRIIDNKNGSSVQIYPDGSLYIINSDGSTIQKNPDGTEISSQTP